ncbi:MAG: putative deoxyribonuclease YcfH [Elusimicrobia bacterium ADurb.Bin231]|nr:MAG: putative deoxyribonuclease YcfH [Elusimicrobia bacterium ADurb.Bin231]
MIDTHCHITSTEFVGQLDTILCNAARAGVTGMIEIGVCPDLWDKTLSLVEREKNIYCAFGIHPNDCFDYKDFTRLLNNKKVVAVGECGLDYHYDTVPPKKQRAFFEKQIEIAIEYKKPLIVHCRDAEKDVCDILKNCSLRGVIHCFSSIPEYAEKFLSMGFFLGIGGPVTYPKAKNIRDSVAITPLERILLETDSPYLPPQSCRGTRNEPGNLPEIAGKIAEIKKITDGELVEVTDINAANLFGIMENAASICK